MAPRSEYVTAGLFLGSVALKLLLDRRKKKSEKRRNIRAAQQVRISTVATFSETPVKPQPAVSISHVASPSSSLAISSIRYLLAQSLFLSALVAGSSVVYGGGKRGGPMSVTVAASGGACFLLLLLLSLGKRVFQEQQQQDRKRQQAAGTTGASALQQQQQQPRAPPQDLTGTWHKDRAASDSMEEAVAVMRLNRMVCTAVRLIKGIRIRQTAAEFEMAILSGILWFKVTERYPLDGGMRHFKRRDLRRGQHDGSLSVTPEGHIRLSLAWPEPLGGTGNDLFYLTAPDVLHVDSTLHLHGRTVFYRTVYRRQGA